LLGELHGALAPLDLPQRPGWDHAVEVVANPDLHRELAWYETFDADGARILRWHADRAAHRFEELAARSAPDTVLHGDFAPWNLLWDERGRLSGVLDFEFTHRNVRVSDFALAWRGRHDQVIRGYREVNALDDRELALIAPAFWSWMLIGLAEELREERQAGDTPHDRSWITRMMLRRTPLMGDDSTPYQPTSR
jgi:Ser/Thr protein kinase RdoA (MazF antagonist)